MAKYKTPKELHPLYQSWSWMRRMSKKYVLSDDWKNDFYCFVKEMGERPSNLYKIYRKDKTKGYCKENCEWREIIPNEDKSTYQKLWRKRNPEKAKNNDLKKMYGITYDDFKTMHDKQEGLCAICGQPEKYNGSLAIDHNHKTGKVRGLLCTNCNRALGCFMDSTDNLKNALSYLETYRV